jgi:hypothetical protein
VGSAIAAGIAGRFGGIGGGISFCAGADGGFAAGVMAAAGIEECRFGGGGRDRLMDGPREEEGVLTVGVKGGAILDGSGGGMGERRSRSSIESESGISIGDAALGGEYRRGGRGGRSAVGVGVPSEWWYGILRFSVLRDSSPGGEVLDRDELQTRRNIDR